MSKKPSPAPVKKNQKTELPKQKTSGGPLWILSAIVLLTALLYSNSLHNEILTFDDNEYFQNYPEIRNLSWESIRSYFSGYYVIMYQPLPVLTFALNYFFTGTETSPLHLVNLLLHLSNIVLVYYFIRALVPGNTIPLIVALLFGIHPMNVEAVAWISARSSSMYTLFYLAALISYTRWIKDMSGKYYFLTLLFFLFSLFSKAQAVTLPVVLLLVDYYFGRSFSNRSTYFEKIPFFLLSIIFGLITLSDIDTQRNLTEGMLISYNAVDIFFLVSWSFIFYLFRLILPLQLCAVYVFPEKTAGWLPWEYYAAGIVFVFLLGLLYRYRKNKDVMFCTGLFLITIAINIQVIPSRLFIVTDRYAYFPYLGLFLLSLLLIFARKKSNPVKFEKSIPVLTGLLSAIVVFYSYITYNRNFTWKSDVPFLTDIIEKNPPVGYIYRAYGNRGVAYMKSGMLPEALLDYNASIKLNPDDSRTYYNRALVYFNQQQYALSLTDLNKAISMDAKQPLLYNDRGQARLLLKDTTGAVADLYKCLELDSTFSDAYNSLATIEFAKGNFDASEKLLTKAIYFNPAFSIAIKNRGLVYLQVNRKADACNDFQNASYLNNEEAKSLFQQYCR